MAPDSTNPTASSRKTKASGTPSTAKKAVKKKPIGNGSEKIHSESSGVVSMTTVETPKAPDSSEEAGVRSGLIKTKGKKRRKQDSGDNERPTIQPETRLTNTGAQTMEIPAVVLKGGPNSNARKFEMSLRAPGLRLVNNELQKVDDPSAKLTKQEQRFLMGIPSKKSTQVAKELKEIDIRGDVDSLPSYRFSHFGGGIFLPIEPVFSRDEQFLFLAFPHCLRVYSTKTSLLHRVFNIPGSALDLPPTSEKRIVSYQLDPLNENHVFVTTFSGQIFLWDWTEGQQVGIWHTEHRTLLMEICPDEDAEINTQNSDDMEQVVIGKRTIYIVAQPPDDKKQQGEQGQVLKRNEIKVVKRSTKLARKHEEAMQKKPLEKHTTANKYIGELGKKQLKQPPWMLFQVTLGQARIEGSSAQLRQIHKISSPVISFKVLAKGTLVALASGSTLWIGNKSTSTTRDNIRVWGSWRLYTIDSRISCMDVRVFNVDWDKKGVALIKGYVAIGNVKGEIHLWHDILNVANHGGKLGDARRLHWHRDVVGAVKLSIDGNYVISGGNETVLVLWQIDTGRKQFLPHLTSAIEHIVISTSGTSYGIRLSDNSVMVLSTTELQAKANITGIQAAAMPVFLPNQPDATTLTWMDLLKNEDESPACNFPSPPRTRCVVHPTHSSHLLMATSSHSTSSLLISPEAAAAEPCPYLQTYDTFSDRSVAKQALTRTHATDVKISPSEIPLVEPSVRALAISPNGEWLASLDEWSPPVHNTYDYALLDPSTPTQGGREVFLKFWRCNNTTWDLVTRVDSPHPDPITATFNGGAKVLDLVALPDIRVPGFATLGADGSVRIWKPRIRTRGGVVVKHRDLAKGGVKTGEDIVQVNWGCRKVIHFSRSNAISLNPFSGGALAMSNDKSVLAVAVNSVSTTGTLGTVQASSAIYIIDPTTSLTLHTLHGLQVGHISSLHIVDRYMVVLGTTKFILFDLVSGRVKWDLLVGHLIESSDPPSPDELFMDADLANGTVSIAVNLRLPNKGDEKDPLFWQREENRHCQWMALLTVFDLTHPKPIPVFREEKTGIAVSALKAMPFIDTSVGGVALGSGYLYLDSFARVNYLTPLTTTIPRRLLEAQTGVDMLGLSSIYLAPTIPPATSEENHDMDTEDLDTRSLVPPQVLTNALFSFSTITTGESGVIESMQQAYAMMDIAEAFDRVVGLYARPPLTERVEGGVDEMDIDVPGIVLV